MNFLVRLTAILAATLTLSWSMDLLESWRSLFDFVALVQVTSIIVVGLLLSFRPATITAALRASLGSHRSLEHAARIQMRGVWVRGHSLAWAAGVIGLVLHIIQFMRNMDDPSAMGPAIATGLLPFLYGAILAELCFSPLADGATTEPSNDVATQFGAKQAVGAALAVLVMVFIVLASMSEIRSDDVWRAKSLDVKSSFKLGDANE